MREKIIKISYYERLLMSKPLSPVLCGSLIGKVCKLRKELSKGPNNVDSAVIIDDAIKFVQVEEKLMCMPYSDAMFGEMLVLFKNDYARVKQHDKNKMLLTQCKTSLKNVKCYYKKQVVNRRLNDLAKLEKHFIAEDKKSREI